MNWTLISAVNNEDVLRSCLLDSPGVRSGPEMILQRGYSSAAAAYNAGIQQATTDLLVFAHQDMYLPAGWAAAVEKALKWLSANEPDWGVLGVWGATDSAGRAGYLYWTGLEGMAGKPFDGAIEVTSLDEVLLIVRKSSGLRFDENLPGFHLYGADLCLSARNQGMKSYAISAFCIHNTDDYRLLPLQFWRGYMFMRRKWKAVLPVATPCTEISRWCWPMIRWNLIRVGQLITNRYKCVRRVADPGGLYQDLIRNGKVQPQICPAAVVGPPNGAELPPVDSR